MERILTKEEIAELLSAVQSGEIETETGTTEVAAAPERSVKQLDLFRGASGGGNWQSASFDALLEAFARNHGISLTNRLQRSVSIKRRSVEAMNFDPFLVQLSDNGAIGIMRLDPLSHGGLLFLDAALSYTLVEIMLGGCSAGGEPLIPSRALTTIELNLVKHVMESACLDLRKAFMGLETINASLVKVESDPRMINIVTPETEMMVVTYDVSVDTVKAIMTLAIPYASLEPLREKLKGNLFEREARPDNAWTSTIKKMLTAVEMEVAAQLGEVTLKIRDIIDLRAGDIIDLDLNPNRPLRILVEGKPKFLGLASMRNGKKTVHVTAKPVEALEDETV